MVYAPVRWLIPELGYYLSVQAHKPYAPSLTSLTEFGAVFISVNGIQSQLPSQASFLIISSSSLSYCHTAGFAFPFSFGVFLRCCFYRAKETIQNIHSVLINFIFPGECNLRVLEDYQLASQRDVCRRLRLPHPSESIAELIVTKHFIII